MAFPGQPPPLTPVLLAGLAARPVPPAVLQPLLDLAMAAAESLFVEANDLAGAALLAGRAHALGPFVNVYNEGTLVYLAKRGAVLATDLLRAE